MRESKSNYTTRCFLAVKYALHFVTRVSHVTKRVEHSTDTMNTERNGHSSVNTRLKQMQCRGNTGPLRTPLRPRYQQHSCALAPLISDSTGFLAWYLPNWMPLKDPARTGRGFSSQPHVGSRHEGDDVRCLIISDWRLAPCLQQSLPIEVMNTGPGRCGIRRASRPLTTASSSPWSSRKANSDGGDAGGRMSSYSLAFNPSVV